MAVFSNISDGIQNSAESSLTAENQDILENLRSMAERDELVGVFDDIPIEVYHHPLCPGVSSTQIKKILRSTNHFLFNEIESRDALRFGNAFHTLILEPSEFMARYRIVDKVPKGYQPSITERISVSLDEHALLQKMKAKFFEHPDAMAILGSGLKEKTFFAKDMETGLTKKCRGDIWRSHAFDDIKTCKDASERSFKKDCEKFDYQVSGAFYLETGSEATLTDINEFNLIACEKDGECDIAVYGIDAESLYDGERLVRIGMRRLKDYFDNKDGWKGYPLGIKALRIRSYHGLLEGL